MSAPISIGLDLYWQEASKILERVTRTQNEAIRSAAGLFADCLENGGVIQAFGTGHSRTVAMELAGRAGGLVPVNRIDLEDLAFFSNWPLEQVRLPEIERNLHAGREILACYRIEPHDVFLIASHSGANVAIVEVALQAKERNHKLIAVTSLEHSRQAQSYHPSGKKLYEVADVVIDNCCPFGDTFLDLPEGGRACSTSSLNGILLAQMLTAETIRSLITRGVEPPIFLSANVPGGIEQGERLRQRYAGRLNERW